MLQNAASDQGLHCLRTEYSIKILIKVKTTTQQPLKWKLTGPIDMWEIPFSINGLTGSMYIDFVLCHKNVNWTSSLQNLSLGLLTKRDSNQPPQLQRLTRTLKFRLKQVEI